MNTRGVLESGKDTLFESPSPQSPPLKGGEMEGVTLKGGEIKCSHGKV
jgi:hypothetical protein